MNPVLRPFTVGLIQMRCSDDSEENLRKASALLRRAADQGVQVACLPELFRTRYFCQSEDSTRFELAEPIPGPTTEALAQVARETKMVIVGSIFERRAARTLSQHGGCARSRRRPAWNLPQDAHSG